MHDWSLNICKEKKKSYVNAGVLWYVVEMQGTSILWKAYEGCIFSQRILTLRYATFRRHPKRKKNIIVSIILTDPWPKP